MSEVQRLPLRSEVNEADTWDLTDMYESDQAWSEELLQIQEEAKALGDFQGHLHEGAEQVLALFRLEDRLDEVYSKLYCYSYQKLDQDTANGTSQEMNGKMRSAIVALNAAGAFILPELLALPEGTLEGYLQQEPELEVYGKKIERILREKPHTLSDKEERLIAMTGEMAGSPTEIYSSLNNADLRFPEATDRDGVQHAITHGSFIPLMQSDDRVLRESAFRGLYGAYFAHENTIAATLAAQQRQLLFRARVRNYPDMLTASLEGSEVPVAVYTNLIEAVHHNLPQFYRYTRLRKKLLGVDELHMYDMYAPMVKDLDWQFTFEEAKALCLEAVAPLGAEYQAMMQEGFENRWIDVYENQGKRSGAYSSGGNPHPYVLLNFQGELGDVFTLIHEMGHSLHTWLSRRNQPQVYSDYVIFVAEVASTCNEALLMQHLLKVTEDRKKRAYLLNYFLEQFRSTLYRQTMFAEFELKIGKLAEEGAGLTAENFKKIYGELNTLYFGPDVISDPEIAIEWARIPHFYRNYYVYQYATGYSAAIALSTRILQEGASAVEDYLKFLSGGSSEDPIALLKVAGVDMTTPEPVNRALQLFDRLIDQMEEVMQEV